MGMNTIKSSSIRLLNGELPKPPKVNDQVEVLDFSQGEKTISLVSYKQPSSKKQSLPKYNVNNRPEVK